jgi:hypothetical protein
MMRTSVSEADEAVISLQIVRVELGLGEYDYSQKTGYL